MLNPTLSAPAAVNAPLPLARLGAFLRDAAQAESVAIDAAERLSGGAIQQNWRLDVSVRGGPWHGTRAWVLRTDAKSALAASLGRAQEFAVLQVAHATGVATPQPLWWCGDRNVLGRDFFVMARLPGAAAGHRLTRAADEQPELAATLGAHLARLHGVRPPHAGLHFLAAPAASHAHRCVAEYRAFLDSQARAFPALEWGLRWCELNAPLQRDTSLIHRDFRTGNYLVDEGRLAGVLDWEFAAWGDPMEDLGWFSARCWRFARPDRTAGGIAGLEPFLRGYTDVSALDIDPQALHYWQVLAHLRWAVIALQQEQRHLCGEERSLELALTGRMVAELSHEVLRSIEGAPR